MSDIGESLKEFDACTISDALDTLQLGGAVSGLAPVWEGARTSGRVITMKVVADPGAKAERHLGAEAIETAAPGDVIVIQQPPSSVVSATWGGLLARAAHLQGIGGVVIDGNCRDVDEIRDIGLPVLSRGVVPFTARRRYVEATVGEPVVIEGVEVRAGDYVVADGSGATFIRADDAARVVERAQLIVRRELLMVKDLMAGASPSTVMGKDYEELLDA